MPATPHHVNATCERTTGHRAPEASRDVKIVWIGVRVVSGKEGVVGCTGLLTHGTGGALVHFECAVGLPSARVCGLWRDARVAPPLPHHALCVVETRLPLPYLTLP